MSIKEIFEQATGREAIVQDGLTTDTTYNVGEISRKTGLQKQPDGSWAPPKGAQKAPAKKEEGRSAEERQAWASMNGFKNEEEMKKAEKDALEFERKFKAGEIDAEGNPKKPAASQDPKRTDNTTGKDYKAGQTVPQAAAMQETMAHRERQAMQAYSKLKQEGASSDETYAAAQLVRSSRDLGELLRVIAKDPEDPLNEATAEKLNGMMKEHDQLQKEVDNIKSRRTIITKNTTGGIEGKLSGDYLQDYKQIKSFSGKDVDKAIQAGAIEYQKSHPGASEGAALEFAVGNLNRLRDSYVRQDKSFKNVTEEELVSAATGKPAASSETDHQKRMQNAGMVYIKNRSTDEARDIVESVAEGNDPEEWADFLEVNKFHEMKKLDSMSGNDRFKNIIYSDGTHKFKVKENEATGKKEIAWISDGDYTAESINAPREKMERTLTKDTKIRLNQIQRETQDARRTYKVGEISEKTGLQKQPNGTWAPPKNAAPAASKKKAIHTSGGEPHKPGSLYKTDPAKLAEQARKEGNAKKAEFYEAEAKKEAASCEAKPDNTETAKLDKEGGWTGATYEAFQRGENTAEFLKKNGFKKEKSIDGTDYYHKIVGGKDHSVFISAKTGATQGGSVSKADSGVSVKINPSDVELDGLKIPKEKIHVGGINPVIHTAVLEVTSGPNKGDRILGGPEMRKARAEFTKKGYKWKVQGEDWDAAEVYGAIEGDPEAESWFFNTYKDELLAAAKGQTDAAPTLASIFESVKK